MFGKRSRFFLILLASVVVPYFWFSDQWSSLAKSKLESFLGTEHAHTSVRMTPVESPNTDGEPPQSAGVPALSPPPSLDDLSKVFRFDVSPENVTQRWPRVSTIRADQDLEGLRVSLVTGTTVGDLTGSLTYYFDRQRRLQRIGFHGRTGDERKLVELATRDFGLRPEPTLGPGLYVARWNARPTSCLRIAYAAVVRSDDPHSRLQVAFEVNRPDTYYGLSHPFEQLLLHDRQTWRW